MDMRDISKFWRGGGVGITALLFAGLLGLPQHALAQNSSPKKFQIFTSDGSALTTAPSSSKKLKFINRDNLRYGRLAITPSRGGTATINVATGAKSVTGGVIDLGGRSGRAEFTLLGEANTRYLILMPDELPIFSQFGSGELILTDLKILPSEDGWIDKNNKVQIYFAATLQLPQGTREGEYSGSVEIYVEYFLDGD